MKNVPEDSRLKKRVEAKKTAKKHLPIIIGDYSFASGYSARDTAMVIKEMLPYVGLTEKDVKVILQENF